LFLVAVVLAAVAAFASARANQGAMRLSKTAPANAIVVTNTNDSGPGSLRDALAVANDGDTINFDSSLKGQTITLTSGELNVDKDVTISGPGANNLTVDGNAQSRVFYVNPGTIVAISGLTITNGYTNDGGGIWNDGALMLSDCTVSDNSAEYGGGILNLWRGGNATLTVTNCTVSGNSALYGGGIENDAFNGGATLTITNSTISGNSGGGIDNSGTNAGAVLTITNSTISGNSGGGIANGAGPGGATVTVINSTISDNSADYGGGISSGCSVGGVVSVTVSNSTLSGNSAAVNGGSIYNAQYGTSATMVISNTILNAGNSGENIFNDGGTVTSHGFNLSSDDGGGVLTGPGDQINTDPMLGPLQDNGGPTFTHALFLGSPAINAADPSFTPPPFFDQRGPGFDRVVNGRLDIGSFEIQGPTPTPTPRPSPTPRPHPTVHPRPDL
jgi:hypothetical protein